MKIDFIQRTALFLATATALVASGGIGCNMNPNAVVAGNPGAVVGDYGDAPDILPTKYANGKTAEFPTRYGKNGAHHLDLTDSAFGPFKVDGTLSVSSETDALDPADPDGVQNIDEPTGASDNDDYDDGLLTAFLAPGVDNTIDFIASVAPGAPEQTRYVNMLADWNQDGYWDDLHGTDEWIVVNMPISVTPGTTAVLTTPTFTAGANSNVWLRMTMSDEPIDPAAYPDGWNGTGEFAVGETEDYLMKDEVPLDLDNIIIIGGGGPGGGGPGGGGPGGGGPGGGGPGGGGGGGGGSGCEFYKSYSATICKGQSRTFLALVDDFAPDSVTATSSNPGVASVEVNEANVTITGNSEGTATIHLTVVEGKCVYYVTVFVKIKDCSDHKPRKACCTPAEIAKDPGRCKNCHAVGWTVHTNETPAGGGDTVNGGITLTGSHGNTDPNLNTKTTVVRVGNVIKIITTYYECEPCDHEPEDGDWDCDMIPDEEDWFPYEAYDPANPHDLEEELYVDSFFDVFFDVNTTHEIFDQTYFEDAMEEVFQEEGAGEEAYPEEMNGEVYLY